MIEVIREGNAAGDLQRMFTRLADFSDVLPDLGRLAVESLRKNIDESRTPDGVPYPPLKRPRPRGHNQDPKPLVDTGAMDGSIHFELRGTDAVFAGPSLDESPYFPIQNQGAIHRGVPPRTFIGVRAEDEDGIRSVIGKHITLAFEVAA